MAVLKNLLRDGSIRQHYVCDAFVSGSIDMFTYEEEEDNNLRRKKLYVRTRKSGTCCSGYINLFSCAGQVSRFLCVFFDEMVKKNYVTYQNKLIRTFVFLRI